MNILKRISVALAACLAGVVMYAQTPTGGAKGTVVNRADRTPIEGAVLKLTSGAAEIGEMRSDAQGNFLISELADGIYNLTIEAPGYLPTIVNVTVNDGYVKNMFNLSLSPSVVAGEVDDSSFGEFDLDGNGYEDTPTILYDQNDVFNNQAGYNFSAVRFKARGYARLSGILLNCRNVEDELAKVEKLADDIDSRIISVIPRESIVQQAEALGRTVVAAFPDSPMADTYRTMAKQVLEACRDDH